MKYNFIFIQLLIEFKSIETRFGVDECNIVG